MSAQEPVETSNLDIYGNEAQPWSSARDAIAGAFGPKAHSDAYTAATLGTVRPDGRPHAAMVGAIWVDDMLYFVSGPGTRKSKNLAANPNCTFALHARGMDIVFEGVATRVTDAEALNQLAEQYRVNGWPAEVDGDAFTAPYSAPSAGPPPWYLYRFTIHKAIGVGAEEGGGATRWQFDER
jgi:Pyridoxamine 5'-phosphate oxidase